MLGISRVTVFPVFLHTNKVSSCILMWISCILIRYRFTNERHSSTMKTIHLPRLARSLLNPIGSCRVYYIFKIKASRFRKRHSFIQLQLAGNLKTLFEFRNVHSLEYVFFFTNTVDLQTALSACVSVRES